MAQQPAPPVMVQVVPSGPFWRVVCSRHGYVISAADRFRGSIEAIGHATTAHGRVGAATARSGP